MLHRQSQQHLAVLFHRVGPYHFARLRAAGKKFATTLIEVFKEDAVYGWMPVPGADGFERVTLFERHPQPARRLNRAIVAALDNCRPDVVAIPGWSDAVAFAAIKWCLLHRVPVVVMSESTAWDEPRRFWKEWIKRRLMRLCAGGIVGGRPHAEYLARLGIPATSIFQGYDAVDNDYYAGKAAEARSHGPELRKKLGLPENYFLASARFVEKKNLFRLIKAYGLYRKLAGEFAVETSRPWDLVLLGDGPLRPELCELIDNLGLQSSVWLPGFNQYDKLPFYYGLAKVFIHASTVEQWGLVVNEAMASGLPVLVSHRCGCAQDLVQEKVNGFAFDPYNYEELAKLMSRLSAPGVDLEKMGCASKMIVAQWGPDRFAGGMAAAVDKAVSAPPPHPTWVDYLLLNLLLMR